LAKHSREIIGLNGDNNFHANHEGFSESRIDEENWGNSDKKIIKKEKYPNNLNQ